MDLLARYGRFIIPALLVLTIGVWVLTPSSRAKRIHGPCLVHGDCHATERCLVVPARDGFATEGECVDPCDGDLQCPPQHHCAPFAEVGKYWTPPGSGKGSGAPVGGCRSGARP
jgi:hypothetical protein